MYGGAEAEIPPRLCLETVDILQLVAQGALPVLRNLGIAERSYIIPPDILSEWLPETAKGTGIFKHSNFTWSGWR